MTTCLHDAVRVKGLCYWCAKCRAMNGGRAKLSEEQLTFVGFLPERPPDPDGWRPAWTLLPSVDDEDRNPETTRGITWLMQVGRDRMELSV